MAKRTPTEVTEITQIKFQVRRRKEPALQRELPLQSLSSLGIGCRTSWYGEVRASGDIEPLIAFAKQKGLRTLYLGEGTNVLFSDHGFDGLIIRNLLKGLERDGNRVRVAGGENLCEVIEATNRYKLAGIECLYGIPGSIAGAVVGNAGAYGQEIGEAIENVEIWDEGAIRTVPAQEAGFRYRHSVFKERKDWFIGACTLKLSPTRQSLQEISHGILAQRQEKYPPDIRCPGSFFKNILLDSLTPEARRCIPASYIVFDKVPAGKLLEAVGANGQREGGAEIASYHGNLFINRDGATCRDLLSLADRFSRKVWERFQVRLEPEVLIVDAKKAE